MEKIKPAEGEPKIKALYIDDSKSLIESAGRAFLGNKNILFVECHNVEEALKAIKKNKPSIIFLDHSLSDDGSEGLKIADKIKGEDIKIYSTTSNSGVASEYEKRGIEKIGKTDILKIKSIVEEEK